jgi:hypothetical protein
MLYQEESKGLALDWFRGHIDKNKKNKKIKIRLNLKQRDNFLTLTNYKFDCYQI